MDKALLHKFYENVILPQFDFKADSFLWMADKELESDIHGFWFDSKGSHYILVWQDFGGTSKSWIADLLQLQEEEFDLVKPIPTKYENEVKLTFGTNYTFIEYVTGSFSLVKISSKKSQ